VLDRAFAIEEEHEANDGHDGAANDEVRAEPVILLTLVKDNLRGADAEREEPEPDAIHRLFEAGELALEIGRVLHNAAGEQQ